MDVFLKNIWIVFIAFAVVNFFQQKSKFQKRTDIDDDLKTGYHTFIKRFLIFTNIPWLIVGIGNLSGFTNSMFDYFRPRTLNPMVLVFHGYIIVMYFLTIYWIYFNNGAGFFVKHPGLIQFNGPGISKNLSSTLSIKLFFAFALLGGAVGILLMWCTEIPDFAKPH